MPPTNSANEPLLRQENENITQVNQTTNGGYLESQAAEILLLLGQAMASLIVRLWMATISISLLMYIIRRVTVSKIRHQSGILFDESPIEIVSQSPKGALLTFEGSPSLFGEILSQPISGPAMFINHDGCTPFELNFPKIKANDIPWFISFNNSAVDQSSGEFSFPWIGLVQRGGCPFDSKIYNMQEAGFKVALVFNHHNDENESTIRMAAHTLGDKVNIFSAFLDRNDGIDLATIVLESNYPFLTISTQESKWISTDIVLGGLIDMGVLSLLVIITATGFLVFGLVINVAHNLYVHGEMMFMDTIQEASMLILNGQKTSNPPRLSKISFPSRILKSCDLTTNWKDGGTIGHEQCPICIDDFEEGNRVRDLPCRHLFHDTW